MKDFSITRIPNNDLIGLLFTPIKSFSEYEIEVVHPEYIDGYYYPSNSGVATAAQYNACADVDISKYDYVLIPVTSNSGSFNSGLNDSGAGSAMSANRVQVGISQADNAGVAAYAMLKVIKPTLTHALINVALTDKLPVIGFRRHRSDNVNPRSPQRLELEPIEIRERQESEPEPVPEIAEPEEETPEEVEEE